MSLSIIRTRIGKWYGKQEMFFNRRIRLPFFFALFAMIFAPFSGCVSDPLSEMIPGMQATPPPNPIFVANSNPDFVWDRVVDAVDDYFVISREEPVRTYGNVLSEGRIDTFPQSAATYLEPWYKDSVSAQERLESTLQTIQRKATVRVIPENGGFSVAVAVYREMENLERPLRANSGATNFRRDTTIKPLYEMETATPVSQGWIAMGRDTALEQRILLKILHNIENPPQEVNL